MGLDMWVNASHFMVDYCDKGETNTDRVLSAVSSIIGELPNIDRSVEIKVQAAYWRKVNWIHHWFVTNIQDGEDDCGRYYLSRTEIAKLIAVCKQVLEDHSLAEQLLPSKSGFFFGGTEYDNWYFQSLEHTIEMLEPLLDEKFKGWNFEYASSW